MRKLSTIVCISLLSIHSSAQVAFELPSAMPAHGSEVLLLWNGNSTMVPTTGTNVLWDFTNVVTSEPEAVQYLVSEPDSTPAGPDFPSATHACGYMLNFDTIWNYYALASDTLWHLGGDYGDLLLCTTPRLTMVFPYAIGDLAVNTATCVYVGPPVNTTWGIEPVATGDILYPGGTIPNVVLVRAYQDGTPTGYYHWYRMNNVLTSVGRYYNFGVELWVPGSGVGIPDHNANGALATYPVPAASEVTVLVGGNATNLFYSLHDAAGRVVTTGNTQSIGDRIRIDVSSLANGQYQLRLLDGEVLRYARVCVAH